jgi:hypothetical protein
VKHCTPYAEAVDLAGPHHSAAGYQSIVRRQFTDLSSKSSDVLKSVPWVTAKTLRVDYIKKVDQKIIDGARCQVAPGWEVVAMDFHAIEKLCSSLVRRGWGPTFAAHGLDLTANNLRRQLKKPLHVDRTRPGFEDFCLGGNRAIEPGDPARSLLYHALASPDVHPTANGQPAPDNRYPTPLELDLLENYIYSLRPVKASALKSLFVGVFAYEYRPAASSAHGYHADFVFSRTGISRVGTDSTAWDGPSRSYRPDPQGRKGISVCPSRFGAFLARAIEPDVSDPIMGRRDEQNDQIRTFYYPVHKLFSGAGSIKGRRISLAFREYHRNEKLQRLHLSGRIKLVPGFDIESYPFVRDSRNDRTLVRLKKCGSSVLLVPQHHGKLVRPAKQKNGKTKRTEVVRFIVPPKVKSGSNRFSTSLQMPTVGEARRMPEYVNIRHPVRGHSNIADMQGWDTKRFDSTLKKGKYQAAHFLDETCEGAITVALGNIKLERPTLPAYSLVAAPDFFPLADQLEISNWVRRNYRNYQEHFRQGAPWPLCEGRRAANIELPRPDRSSETAFQREDLTVTAIVGAKPRSRQTIAPARKKQFASFMTDAASNEFDPGWDVSLTSDKDGSYLASYGLGSPFPEDAKLCAALNSFWPAVAPDASRTFAFQDSPTAIPMLDSELGYHPEHPDVRAGRVRTARGWDGEYGPFLETLKTRIVVNAASLDRSDYVSNALRGWITVRKTSSVDSDELIKRMDALRRCIATLPPGSDHVSNTKLWLVKAERVLQWDLEASRADSRLSGPGFHFVFVTFDPNKSPTEDLTRVRFRVKKMFDCQISETNFVFRVDNGSWKFSDSPKLETPPST